MGEPFDDVTPTSKTDRHALPSRGPRVVVGLLVGIAVVGAAVIGVRRLHLGGDGQALLEAGERELSLGHDEAAVSALRSARTQHADPSRVDPLLSRAERNVRETQDLTDAKRAVAEHRFDDARVLLQGVDPGSPRAADAQKQLAGLGPARAAYLYQLGTEALARGDLAQARAQATELAALEPELGKQLGSAIAEASVPTTPGGTGSSPVAARVGPDPVVRKALAQAFARFDHPDQLAAAEAEFAREGRSHPDGAIRAEARALALGTHACAGAIQLLQRSPKVPDWIAAVQACSDVDPSAGTVAGLRAGLAGALVAEGDQAATAGRYLQALKDFRAAQATVPEHGPAASAVDRLRRRLDQVAAHARAAKQASVAREDWTVVLELAPQGDPLHVEAARALSGGP